jgi:hypothetical protein
MVRPLWSDQVLDCRFRLARSPAGLTARESDPMHALPDSVERVARELREGILRRRYRPGDRLPSERDLAERLHVSRGACY